jgi:hypothetical protein
VEHIERFGSVPGMVSDCGGRQDVWRKRIRERVRKVGYSEDETKTHWTTANGGGGSGRGRKVS